MVDLLTMADIAKAAKSGTVPFSVLIEVCYRCNENCIHCYLEEHRAPGMTLKQYETLFDQLVDAGTMFVIFTGGEPFMRDDFMEIVAMARDRHLSVTIFTNGLLLNSEIVAELKRLYVQQVHISLYSADSSQHDAITSVTGSHAKSVAGIRMLQAAGVMVKIKCPLMKGTFEQASNLRLLANELGVSVQFGTVITAKNNGDTVTRSLQLSDDQLRQALLDPEIGTIGTEPVHIADNLDCIPCDTIFNGGAIDPYGNVYPCNQWLVRGGNVLETPFGEIWSSSSAFQELRTIRLRDLKACQSCELFSHCARCPGLAHLEDGELLGCSSSAKLLASERQKLGAYPTQAHIFSPAQEKNS